MGLVKLLRVEVARIFPLLGCFPLFIDLWNFTSLNFDSAMQDVTWGWTSLQSFSKIGLDILKNDINRKYVWL